MTPTDDVYQLIVDFDGQNHASIYTTTDGGSQQLLTRLNNATWPLDPLVEDNLRWYLEDYLDAPYGTLAGRAEGVLNDLATWGRKVLETLFGSDPALDEWAKSRMGSRLNRLVIRSADPTVLAKPWELICCNDPKWQPLALNGIGIDRSLPSLDHLNTLVPIGDRLRILMIIARPRGADDVGYQLIGRPLLSRLEAVRGHVELEVLRPPTLQRLEEVLTNAASQGKPFHIVHFDGHGAAGQDTADGFSNLNSQAGLVFEWPDGAAHTVPAERVAQVMGAAGIPVVVLNACRSGAVSRQLEAAVAIRLLTAGVASVVAMAYNVYAVAAAEFMTAFYGSLFAGDTVSAAVSAGRIGLARNNLRPSLKGPIALADWLIPVHYARDELRFQALAFRQRSNSAGIDDAVDQLSGGGGADEVAGDPVQRPDGFVGRDADIYRLETACRSRRTVLLHGLAGVGKSEVATAFGRWWRDTGGVERPDLVFRHRFEPGDSEVDLHLLLSRIGVRALGRTFASKDFDEQASAVWELLRHNRCLLIWDDFEKISSMLDDQARRSICAFAEEIAQGSSTLIITSRNVESWLGDRAKRIEVSNFNPLEAVQYANELLAMRPKCIERQQRPEFPDLMKWLNGHPLSMRVILPQLEAHEPSTLLAALRGLTALPDNSGDGLDPLTACIAYSVAQLRPATARCMHALALFSGVADCGLLASLSTQSTARHTRLAGHDLVFWQEVLDEGVSSGLLTADPRFENIYGLHPALTSYLFEQWKSENPSLFAQEHSAAILAMIEAYAGLGTWFAETLTTNDAGIGFEYIGIHLNSMKEALAMALERSLWASATQIFFALWEFMFRNGQSGEAVLCAQRVISAVETEAGSRPNPDSPEGRLWQGALDARGVMAVAAGRFAEAKEVYELCLRVLRAQSPYGRSNKEIAVTLMQLALAEFYLGNLAEAEALYRQCVPAFEANEDDDQLASIFRRLAAIARRREAYSEANSLIQKALSHARKSGVRREIADSHYEGALIAIDSESLERAYEAILLALAVSEELGHPTGVANCYHQLGIIAERLNQLEVAHAWLLRSLSITEHLDDLMTRSATYHVLGVVNRRGGRLHEAEDWLQRSLVVRQALGHRDSIAGTYGELALVAEQRGDILQAADAIIRSIAQFDEIGQYNVGPAEELLHRYAGIVGVETLDQMWLNVTGQVLDPGLRAHLNKLLG